MHPPDEDESPYPSLQVEHVLCDEHRLQLAGQGAHSLFKVFLKKEVGQSARQLPEEVRYRAPEHEEQVVCDPRHVVHEPSHGSQTLLISILVVGHTELSQEFPRSTLPGIQASQFVAEPEQEEQGDKHASQTPALSHFPEGQFATQVLPSSLKVPGHDVHVVADEVQVKQPVSHNAHVFAPDWYSELAQLDWHDPSVLKKSAPLQVKQPVVVEFRHVAQVPSHTTSLTTTLWLPLATPTRYSASEVKHMSFPVFPASKLKLSIMLGVVQLKIWMLLGEAPVFIIPTLFPSAATLKREAAVIVKVLSIV